VTKIAIGDGTFGPRGLIAYTTFGGTIECREDVERTVRLLRSLPVGDSQAWSVHIAKHAPTATDAQRRMLFALFKDIAAQIDFPGGGRADALAWKDFLTGLARGQRVAREGQVVVVIGGGLSAATRAEVAELIDFVLAWGVDRGVQFHDGGRGGNKTL
jgi:hypothetical protein